MKLEFSRQISEKVEISSFIKVRPVGAQLFHADGQTYGRMDGWKDMTKLTVSFRSFVNALKHKETVNYALQRKLINSGVFDWQAVLSEEGFYYVISYWYRNYHNKFAFHDWSHIFFQLDFLNRNNPN